MNKDHYSSTGLIVLIACLIIVSFSGCASSSGGQGFFLQAHWPAPAAWPKTSLESSKVEGSDQAGGEFSQVASATCRGLAIPFLVTGAAGLWYLERTAEDDDPGSMSDIHHRRNLCLLSLGSFLVGSILYSASYGFDGLVLGFYPPVAIFIKYPETASFQKYPETASFQPVNCLKLIP
ncbi:MAG: hypothetical protein K6U11_04925 [bacterium]|nr:hypothetical protein [bacterium]